MADQLLAARKRSGLSLRELARRAGISHTHLYDIENKTRSVSPQIARSIEMALQKALFK